MYECSTEIQTMQRFFNNLDGYIINRATASPAKSVPLSTSRNPSTQVRLAKRDLSSMVHANTWQTKLMHRVGTYLVDVTCHSRNTQKRMKPINKLYIVTVAIRLSGARLAFCTTRSTSTETRLMPTPARYVSTRTSPKSGTTWVLW